MSGLATRTLLFAAVLVGVNASVRAQSGEKPKIATIVGDLEVDDESTALQFAQSHHPELAKLLGPMKSARPKEYQKAIRDLSRVSERLSRLESRSPERYAIELDLWKTESRLRLVAVKTAMVDDEERREQIEKLVADRNALRIRLYEFERAEAEARIVQLDKQIEALRAQEAGAVRKEVDRLVNSAKSSAKRVKTKLEKAADADSPASQKPKPANPKRAPGAVSASQ
jgi:hypothetical protein